MSHTSQQRSILHLGNQELGHLAKMARTSSWSSALSEAYEVGNPTVYQAATSACLTSWVPLLPTSSTGPVLNLDCSLGAVTQGLAERYSRVLHMSIVPEHTAFSQIRLGQEGIHDVGWLQGDPCRIPLEDASVDLLIAVHLFQWADFKAKGRGLRQIERDLALEMFRVVKPGGAAFVGIRQGPLPRSLFSHRRSVAGITGYCRRLFSEAGFHRVSYYYPIPNLSHPRTIVPLDNMKVIKNLIRERISEPSGLKRRVSLSLALLAAHLGALPALFNHCLLLVQRPHDS